MTCEARSGLSTPLTICLLLTLQMACTYTPVYDSQGRPQGTLPEVSEQTAPVERDNTSEIDIPPESPEQATRVAVVSPEAIKQRPSVSNKDVAAAKLRTQAASALAEGQSSKAEQLLNRALRISPRSPETYYQLASIKLEQGVHGQALQLARKGLSLCDPNSPLASQLQILAARARN